MPINGRMHEYAVVRPHSGILHSKKRGPNHWYTEHRSISQTLCGKKPPLYGFTYKVHTHSNYGVGIRMVVPQGLGVVNGGTRKGWGIFGEASQEEVQPSLPIRSDVSTQRCVDTTALLSWFSFLEQTIRHTGLGGPIHRVTLERSTVR